MLSRRGRREPVAYIVGKREFWSLEFSVGPGVLIPRPETELLLELALTSLTSPRRPWFGGLTARVLDLCTGSGAIAVGLSKERNDANVWGTDLSAEAVNAARLNAVRHGVDRRCQFLQGDLFLPVSREKNFFHMIVSNPPYIRRGEISGLPADVRDWEPRMALDGGADGLEFYRRIALEAFLYLTAGGLLLVEIGPDLAAQVCNLLAKSGAYRDWTIHSDYSGKPRVVSARKRSGRREHVT
jgi:release factor glutamine methyltransferase